MELITVSVDSLLDSYRDDILLIIKECQSSGKKFLDIEVLNSRLKELHSFAMYEGLAEDDWYDLLYELTPEIYDQLTCTKIAI